MTIAHVTKTGNISIPKKWRDELGIEPESDVLIHLTDTKIIIEPLKKGEPGMVFNEIDNEIKKKKAAFSREESVKDDLYS